MSWYSSSTERIIEFTEASIDNSVTCATDGTEYISTVKIKMINLFIGLLYYWVPTANIHFFLYYR